MDWPQNPSPSHSTGGLSMASGRVSPVEALLGGIRHLPVRRARHAHPCIRDRHIRGRICSYSKGRPWWYPRWLSPACPDPASPGGGSSSSPTPSRRPAGRRFPRRPGCPRKAPFSWKPIPWRGPLSFSREWPTPPTPTRESSVFPSSLPSMWFLNSSKPTVLLAT